MSRGSSRIIITTIEVTGPLGPTGATGPTGPTGDASTGPDGPQGYGLGGTADYSRSINGVTFYIQNVAPVLLTGIIGNTGNGITAHPAIVNYTGTGISLLTNSPGSSGFTLFFRSVTFSSGISMSSNNGVIYVREDLQSNGPFDRNQLIFVDFSQTTSKYYLDSADSTRYIDKIFDFTNFTGITAGAGNLSVKLKNSREYYTGQTAFNMNYLKGFISDSPRGGSLNAKNYPFISQYSLDIPGSENSRIIPIVNIQALCGSTGNTGFVSFHRRFSSANETQKLGPFKLKVSYTNELGSCCVCSSENVRGCTDYISKTYCDSLNGRWSVSTCDQRLNTYDCYKRGACCLNGRCINTSQNKCIQMHGTFCSLRRCGDGYTCGDQCVVASSLIGSPVYCCCENGVARVVSGPNAGCSGTISLSQYGLCNNQYCCTTNSIYGACCLQDGSCTDRTVQGCAELGGIFRGFGILCEGTTCCQPITT